MHEPRNSQEGAENPSLDRNAARPVSSGPLADREVPLPGMDAIGGTPAAVHAWLDGEGTEADARLADERQVAMWTRVMSDASMRRNVSAPTALSANIMAALPQAAPALATATASTLATATAPSTIQLSAMSALMYGAGLIAVGFLLARVFG